MLVTFAFHVDHAERFPSADQQQGEFVAHLLRPTRPYDSARSGNGLIHRLRPTDPVQQRSTATHTLHGEFVVARMCPQTPGRGATTDLRVVRDEEDAGSNPVTPTSKLPSQQHIQMLTSGADRQVQQAPSAQDLSSRRSAEV